MALSFLDAGSLHQIVQAFDRGHNDQDEWCVHTAINTTTLLLTSDTHHLPPAIPGRNRFYPGVLDCLIDELLKRTVVASPVIVTAPIPTNSMKSAKCWAAKNSGKLKEALRTIKAVDSFHHWLEWSFKHTWVSEQVSAGVLFDPAFAKYLAIVLDVAETEVNGLHKKTLNPRAIGDIVRHRGGSTCADFELLADCYVLSFMLRGRYHEIIARDTNGQINQHPIREMACSSGRDIVAQYTVGNTLDALARIVFYGAAIAHRSLRDRLKCWVDNIVRVKGAFAASQISLNGAPTTSSAIEVAANVAKRAGIETGGHIYTTWLGHVSTLGLGALAELYVESWGGWGLGLGLGCAADLALSKTGAIRAFGNLYHNSERRLRQIAGDSGQRKFKWNPSSDK